MNRHHPLRALLARTAFALSLLCALPGSALADDSPTVQVGKDGTVDGTVVVGAPPDVVQSYLANVARLRYQNTNVVDVEVAREGACELVTTTARNVVEVKYVARRCPTQTGWVETLVDSEMMNDYYAEWFVIPVTGGLEIRMRMRSDMNLPVPDRMIRSAMKSSVRDGLQLMQERLGGPDPAPSQVAAD
jgi:hypothetical protein